MSPRWRENTQRQKLSAGKEGNEELMWLLWGRQEGLGAPAVPLESSRANALSLDRRHVKLQIEAGMGKRKPSAFYSAHCSQGHRRQPACCGLMLATWGQVWNSP